MSSRTPPVELLCAILRLCDNAELARWTSVCSAYKSEAERLLYSNLQLSVWHDEDLTRANSCLETLANSKAKAELVRSFVISVIYSYHVEELSIQTMGKAFRAMVALQHLDLLLSPKVHLADTFQHIFKGCTFSLVTLTINLELIILPKMRSIQVITAYIDSEARNTGRDFLDIFQNLPEYSKSKFFCLGICFDEQSNIGDPDTAFAFPAHLPSHEAMLSWSPEPIVDLLRKKSTPTSEIGTFNVHLCQLANEPVLRHIIQTISYHFPEVWSLTIILDHPDIHVYPDTMSSILGSFPYLEFLNIDFNVKLGRSVQAPYLDRKSEIAEAWAAECPRLEKITFPDDSAVACNVGTSSVSPIVRCHLLD
jgi:hypothetical protein